MRVGAAVVDITPDRPVDLTGFVGRKNPSVGVLDEITTRAFYFEGEQPFVIVVCDVHSIPTPLAWRMRRKVAEGVGVPFENVWVVATHTHSAPGLGRLRCCGEVSDDFVKACMNAAVEAAAAAKKSAGETEGYLVAAVACHVASNRRLPTPKGVERLPNPEGSYDPQILWLRFMPKGRPTAHLVIYGCHPTTLGAENRKISADFVGHLRRLIEEKYGGVALFLPGALGDVAPVPNESSEPEAAEDFALRVFETLAESEWLTEELELEGVVLTSTKESLPLVELGDAELESYLSRADNLKSAGKTAEAALIRQWADDFRLLYRTRSLPETVPLFLCMADFGQTRLVATSAEVFSSYATALRAHCPAPYTALISLTNGFTGHLPDEEGFALGGYEVEIAPLLYGILPLSHDAAEIGENSLLALARYEVSA